MEKFILTQADLLNIIAANKSFVDNGTPSTDWFISRIEFCEFLLKTYELPEQKLSMTEYEMLEYIINWTVANSDKDEMISAKQLRRQICVMQEKLAKWGYDVPN